MIIFLFFSIIDASMRICLIYFKIIFFSLRQLKKFVINSQNNNSKLTLFQDPLFYQSDLKLAVAELTKKLASFFETNPYSQSIKLTYICFVYFDKPNKKIISKIKFLDKPVKSHFFCLQNFEIYYLKLCTNPTLFFSIFFCF